MSSKTYYHLVLFSLIALHTLSSGAASKSFYSLYSKLCSYGCSIMGSATGTAIMRYKLQGNRFRFTAPVIGLCVGYGIDYGLKKLWDWYATKNKANQAHRSSTRADQSHQKQKNYTFVVGDIGLDPTSPYRPILSNTLDTWYKKFENEYLSASLYAALERGQNQHDSAMFVVIASYGKHFVCSGVFNSAPGVARKASRYLEKNLAPVLKEKLDLTQGENPRQALVDAFKEMQCEIRKNNHETTPAIELLVTLIDCQNNIAYFTDGGFQVGRSLASILPSQNSPQTPNQTIDRNLQRQDWLVVTPGINMFIYHVQLKHNERVILSISPFGTSFYDSIAQESVNDLYRSQGLQALSKTIGITIELRKPTEPATITTPNFVRPQTSSLHTPVTTTPPNPSPTNSNSPL
jgi:hypothetical protein